MQNGGLATGLAQEMGRIATVGLAPAIFSSWMNVTGSALANWFRTRPLRDEAGVGAAPDIVTEPVITSPSNPSTP